MGTNYAVFNEVILHGMQFLPESYSERIIEYLTGDFDKKVFDHTSGAENQLELVKNVLKVHTMKFMSAFNVLFPVERNRELNLL